MATTEQLEKENEQLRAEVVELRAKQERLARWSTRVAGFATGAAARILFGRELVGSLRAWLRGLRRAIGEKTVDDRVLDETGDVLAAIVRRVIRVGVVSAAIATLPIILLLWQNFLIREQNAKLQSQIEQQASDNLIVRRAQLLATIYEEECEEGANSSKGNSPEGAANTKLGRICRPKSPLRARQEAALAFVEIERGRGVVPDLSKANLSEADFRDADLSGTVLRGADLSLANLARADLTGADLGGLKLQGRALLYMPVAERFSYTQANLQFANLLEADLSGADLDGVKELTQSQIKVARGNDETNLPLGLERPVHWLKRD